MRTIRSALFGLSAAVVLAGGCAHTREAVPGDEFASEQAVVKVTNHNWNDITVYVVRGTFRHRLGTVSSNTTQTFRLPAFALAGGQNPQLLADPIGSRQAYLSPPIVIGTGQSIEWRIENNLALSSAIVR